MQEEPSYRTAYEKDGKKICPETGTDLSEWSRASILAHRENLYPSWGSRSKGSEAEQRYEILGKIAAEAKE